MWDFFVEGGIGMWPVLIFGLVLVAAAARYAFTPHPIRLRFLAVVSILLVVVSGHAMIVDVAKVLSFVSGPERVPDADLARFLATGLKESSRPGILGGGILSFTLVLVAIGIYRAGLRDLDSSRR